jgi:N-acetyl-anhydromuramyl-L-alanine amidase AmpD
MNRRRFLLASGALVGLTGAGAAYWPRRWNHIVIHHSAGDFATIEFLQEVHRQRQSGDPIDAIPYHYVIGNGNGLGMGEVASDWRRDFDIWGMHVSANNMARNFFGIGICLVGNFETSGVPEKQFQALVSLTKSLMSQYGIPPEHVDFHGMIEGESTKCPGGNFPVLELRQAIA